MISRVALRRTSTGWKFASEAALEKFIWENLQELFTINPLKRQYITNGEICDILAVDNDGGLVVLELKNAEDRYIIQQLTRYYASLVEEKPFQTQVDYTLPIQLIAIAPTYHRHNLIDIRYSRLNFNLLQFSVIQENAEIYFILQNLERQTVQRHWISFKSIEIPSVFNIPEPPELLIEWLSGCTPEEQEGYLKLRIKILSCHQRMKEIIDKKSIQYGSGKTKLCAEICFQRKEQKPILFLWLPTPNTLSWTGAKQTRIGRLRIWTDGKSISHVGHIPEGFGKMKLKTEWEQLPPEKRPYMRESLSSKSLTPVDVEGYLGCRNDEKKPNVWDVLSELAIQNWLERER